MRERSHSLAGSLEGWGAAASLTCAIHCAAMPLLVTLLPVLGLSFLANERIEWILLGSAFLLGLLSVCGGYRIHRSKRVLAILSSAFVLLTLGHFAIHEAWSIPGELIMVVGGLTLAGAQLLNFRLCRSCPHCADH